MELNYYVISNKNSSRQLLKRGIELKRENMVLRWRRKKGKVDLNEGKQAELANKPLCEFSFSVSHLQPTRHAVYAACQPGCKQCVIHH